MFELLFSFGMGLLESFCFCTMLSRMLEPRFRGGRWVVVLSVSLIQCLKIIPSSSIVRCLLALAVDVLAIKILCRDKLRHSFIYAVIFYDLMLLCDGLTISIFQLTQLWHFGIVTDATVAEVAMAAISRGTLLCLVGLFLKLWPSKYGKRLWLYPVIFFIFMAQMAFFPFDADSMYYEHPEGLFILVCIFLLLTMMCLFLAEHYRHRQEVSSEKLKALEVHRAEQVRYVREVQETYRAMSRSVHDMRHHLGLIDVFAQQGEWGRAHTYIQTVFDTYQRANINFTGNVDIDSIIYSKQMRCKDGADFQVSGRLPRELPVFEPADLCILLANALDNAIDACAGIEDAEIKIAFVYSDWLLITVENPISAPPIRDGSGGFVSRKGDGHGLGLKSMEAVVKKYQGHMSIRARNDKFSLDILLQSKQHLNE